MKKLHLLVVSLLIACMLLSLTSCFAPKPLIKDLEQAQENLEDEDFIALYTDEENYLGYGCTEKLSAYDDDDFLYVMVYDSSKTASTYYNTLKAERDAEIAVVKAELKEAKYILKQYEGDMKSNEVDDLEDEIKELEKELEELESVVYGKSGSTIWYGTEKAIEDSKGK